MIIYTCKEVIETSEQEKKAKKEKLSSTGLKSQFRQYPELSPE